MGSGLDSLLEDGQPATKATWQLLTAADQATRHYQPHVDEVITVPPTLDVQTKSAPAKASATLL
jgi:hypothetical protein